VGGATASAGEAGTGGGLAGELGNLLRDCGGNLVHGCSIIQACAGEFIHSEPENNNRRAPRLGALARDSPLPAVVVLDHCLNLLLHRLKIEGCRILHGWVFDGGQGEILDLFLNHNKSPEFPGVKVH
jgi:hypothetical protein